MSKWNSGCKVCGKHSVFNIQATGFYPEGYRKGIKSIFEPCCKECQETYRNNIMQYASLRVVLNWCKITRYDWQWQGCE